MASPDSPQSLGDPSSGEALESGLSAREREKEAIDLMTRAGKLTKIELDRLEVTGQFVTKEQVMANRVWMFAVLRKHVDSATLTKISDKLNRSNYSNPYYRPLHARNFG